MNDSLAELTLAWQFLRQERFVEAERHSASVLARHPDNVSALACHAMALWRRGGPIDTSLTEMGRAVSLAPQNGAIRHNLATLYASNGDIEGSNNEFRTALAINPKDVQAFYGLAQNMRFGDEDDLVRSMVRLYEDNLVAGIDRELLGFALAKAFDDLNQPERAFRYALEVNSGVARPFDLSKEQAALQDLRWMTEADAFRKIKHSGHPTRAPLFIVGMNRSGTTLVESILSRHPQVLAQGELTQMPDLERRGRQSLGDKGREVSRNALLPLLSRDWYRAGAEDALRQTMARTTTPFSVAVDKLPDNALRLGLIAKVFPNAKIVHVRRHPLDVGLSNFFKRFAGGQAFAFRLDWIGAKTRLVADSMALWKQALDLPILDLSYEKLVAQPESETRRLIEFAGLDWTDACLAPEKTSRSVLTASQWQVRQPIYRGAVGRWKQYEAALEPMIAAMGGRDWIDKEMSEIGV